MDKPKDYTPEEFDAAAERPSEIALIKLRAMAMSAACQLRAGAERERKLRGALAELVERLEPAESRGDMNIPGMATLNRARAALADAGEV